MYVYTRSGNLNVHGVEVRGLGCCCSVEYAYNIHMYTHIHLRFTWSDMFARILAIGLWKGFESEGSDAAVVSVHLAYTCTHIYTNVYYME